MRKFDKIFVLLSAFALTGCMVGPDYEDAAKSLDIPDLNEEHFFRDEGLWKNANPSDGLPKGDWWAVFNDPELRLLLEKVKTDNPDLQAAFYRVEQAREAALMQKSQLYPWLSGNAEYSRTGQSKNTYTGSGATFDNWAAGFGITWDADLFGRIRSLLAADVANAQAQLHAYQDLMLVLQSEVAKTYFALRQHHSEKELLQRTLDVRKEQTDLVRRRVKLDYSSDIDLQRALQSEYEASAQLAAVERSEILSKNYMAVLLGTTPSKLVLRAAPLSTQTPKSPNAVPSELLERRPDIAGAERKVFAANAKIGAAQAAFFPTVSLTANTSLSAEKIDKLINSSSFAWGISPQIYIPIFEAGRNLVQKRIALAEHAEALQNYKSTVLSAIREVEDALSNINRLAVEHEKREAVVNASKAVQNLTQKQYDSGFVDYFSVSDAQRNALLNERELLNLQGLRFKAYVDLIAALGGGWNINDIPNQAPENEDEKNLSTDFGQDNILPIVSP